MCGFFFSRACPCSLSVCRCWTKTWFWGQFEVSRISSASLSELNLGFSYQKDETDRVFRYDYPFIAADSRVCTVSTKTLPTSVWKDSLSHSYIQEETLATGHNICSCCTENFSQCFVLFTLMRLFKSSDWNNLLLEIVFKSSVGHELTCGSVCLHKERKEKSNMSEHHCSKLEKKPKQKSICAKEEKSLWRQNNGVKLKQRQRLLVCGTEWQRFDCVQKGGGTAVWLYKDETLRSSIVSPYLGHGSVLTKHHSSPSPCSCGQIMRMFLQANRETDWESHQIKQCHCGASVWSCCCREAEWMDLSPHFVWWYSFFLWVVCAFANVDGLGFIPGLGSTFCQSFCWSLLKRCTAGPIARDHQLYTSRHLWA